MAFFGVTYETIERVWPHPNADRLELSSLDGSSFQFVVAKDAFKPGDKVFYFPIDSVLKNETIEQLGIAGKLSGKNKDRVRTVRLRNELSQGIVSQPEKIIPNFTEKLKNGDWIIADDKQPRRTIDNLTLTELLGIEKYEAPAVICKTANLCPLPVGLSAYDLEGADRFKKILEQMMDEMVCITEKVEGSNFSVTYSILDQEIYVNQRNYTIKMLKDSQEEHTWWKVAKTHGIIDLAKELSKTYNDSVTIYGEIIGPGIQGNYYNLKDHTVKLFDIRYGSKFIEPLEFINIIDTFKNGTKTVPIISNSQTLREWLNGRTIQEAAHGISELVNKIREGIVIKPHLEKYIHGFGRFVLKQRDPIYLEKTGS